LIFCNIKVAIVSTPVIPSSDFTFPKLFPPPPGMEADELDIGERFAQNANTTNEGIDKLRSLLMYLSMFEEVELVDANGFKRVCLVRRTGKEEASTTCSLGTLLTDPSDSDKRYLQQGTVNYVNSDFVTAHTTIGGEGTTFDPHTSSIYVKLEITMETDSSGDTTYLTGRWSATGPPILENGPSTPVDSELSAFQPTGFIYAPLGSWSENLNGDLVWNSEGCGAVTFQICLLDAYRATAHYFRS